MGLNISFISTRLCICIIKGYQLFFSPFFPPQCRFTPSCSNYTLEALDRYGLRIGLYYGLKRLLKCHPFHSGGYDPVK
jgi:putative membrane protein insertion efficiency factor